MKRIIFSILSILVVALTCNSQTFTVSQLKNINWERVYPQLIGEDETIKFTNTQYIIYLTYPRLNKSITQTYPYYLSDTKTLTFDNSQVGKNTKGKYLVVWVEQYQQTYCFNIISMSDDFFKISICEGEMAIYKKKK
jgi:hypothetical protein